MTLVLFYSIFSIALIAALAGRNWLERRPFQSVAWGFLLSVYGFLIVAGIFGGTILHYPLVEGFVQAQDNDLLTIGIAFAPMLWACILAAFFNQAAGR